jgi:hypothetical protein
MCAGSAAYAECTAEPRIPTDRYEINGDQVLDKETQLTWQRCAVGQKFQEGAGCVGEAREVTWAAAKKHSGAWRLPSKDELRGLLSDACLPSLNAEAFPGVSLQQPNYWSSTETAPGLTWIVNLTSGHEFNALQSSTNAMRLVRSQQVAGSTR